MRPTTTAREELSSSAADPLAACLRSHTREEGNSSRPSCVSRSMPSTFDIVADIVALNCNIPRSAITPDCHLLNDLGIDSLDLLDLGFAVDDAFGITMPLGQWLHAAHLKTCPARALAASTGFRLTMHCNDIDVTAC